MPKFSIIIPAYNAENHIRNALDSVAAQTFKDYELLVICDSCTDKTEAIAQSYGAKTFSVDYHNDGLSRSKGLDEATGEWVLFMDDDDWWLHEYVLWQLNEKLRELDDSVDILCFSFIFKGLCYASPRGNRGRHWIAVWNKCWRREAIGNTRFPKVHMCSDKYFHQDMMKKGLNIAEWDMPMYYYNYMREGSQTELKLNVKTPAAPIVHTYVPKPYKKQPPKYMIHTYPSRLWYVEEFLVPSMIAQGIEEEKIIIWNDTEGLGNLRATMKSFSEIPMDDQGTWHLQDDVIISKNFKKLTELHNDGIVCGFCSHYSTGRPEGRVNIRNMWYSFPCIRIPNNMARECSKWFYHSAINDPKYKNWVESKKHDDEFFKAYLREKHPTIQIHNLNPNVVNHVDYMLGGSLVNQSREKRATSLYWTEDGLLNDLSKKIKRKK